jgi:hypothetical protein
MAVWVDHIAQKDKVAVKYVNDHRFSACCCDNNMLNGIPRCCFGLLYLLLSGTVFLSLKPRMLFYLPQTGHYIEASQMLRIFARDSVGDTVIC